MICQRILQKKIILAVSVIWGWNILETIAKEYLISSWCKMRLHYFWWILQKNKILAFDEKQGYDISENFAEGYNIGSWCEMKLKYWTDYCKKISDTQLVWNEVKILEEQVVAILVLGGDHSDRRIFKNILKIF